MLATLRTERTVVAEKLTPALFAPFGGVISATQQLASAEQSSANYGTATKLLRVSPIENRSPGRAVANWNLFRCSPPSHLIVDHRSDDGGLSYPCRVLERHPHSTQTFVPMGRQAADTAYMVIVASSDESTPQRLPDLSTAAAFVVRGGEAVTYGAGTWHAPMIALGDTTDFAVLIHETGNAKEDTEEVAIEELTIEFTLDDVETGDPATARRKPQSAEEYEAQCAEYSATGPPLVSSTPSTEETGDARFDVKQIKYAAERAYFHRNYAEVLTIVGNAKVDGKLGHELAELARRAQEKLAAPAEN